MGITIDDQVVAVRILSDAKARLWSGKPYARGDKFLCLAIAARAEAMLRGFDPYAGLKTQRIANDLIAEVIEEIGGFSVLEDFLRSKGIVGLSQQEYQSARIAILDKLIVKHGGVL